MERWWKRAKTRVDEDHRRWESLLKIRLCLFLIFGTGPTLPGQLIYEVSTLLSIWLDGRSPRLQIYNRYENLKVADSTMWDPFPHGPLITCLHML